MADVDCYECGRDTLLREQGVGGSNPLTPTNLFKDLASYPRTLAQETAQETRLARASDWAFHRLERTRG